jgi:SAM-dependent methyltransferase
VRTTYDTVATAYADQLVDELDGLPFERWLLARVAGHAGGGPVVEVGAGPGHVTAFLAELGADAQGIDLSPGMVEEARRRFPDGDYQVGDLRKLMRPTSAPGWSAVLAWYSLIHLAASELPGALAALTRPLASGGWLVLALHAGAEVRHVDEWFDAPVDLDLVMHDPADVAALVEGAGLRDVEWYVRGPLTARGETTQRLYVVGRKPS